ncbi:ABC transporter ATP-binding protein [Metabacillus idriensis]|uniref:Putative hemin import ATP-binding protein HrtA n=1 Tax=Metabacillus idriensis TaxID=324768 RepID=A0A6I2MCH9_9BACI|nr:ABC transporter ATP-binding protein [Metabacillus idriensis]MCM3596140.1 ABC transporter ATP-binding protein [Metabacillus idriensis]MRX56115.1 ATP-binding cassette domain-containing protein [Metabacillus idriensis]OHR65324.1 hemin ABC transporter ATP-binding protein [Bacillus sp. HMSC76G11]
MTIFQLNDVKKAFMNGEAEEQVLKGISLSLNEGEITALVGASGSGKSTLLTIAAGLQRATQGSIFFKGENVTEMSQDQIRKLRANQFGYIFQSSHLVPFLTVQEQLMLMLSLSETKLKKQEQRNEAERFLKLTDLYHRKDAYPQSLSGGEKQRAAVARALIHKPKIIFADEPTASLDSKRSNDIMKLIKQLTKTMKITTLMVTHDEEMLVYADSVVTMRDGMVFN